MTLKDNWGTGDTYNADDMNALVTQVNADAATLTDTGLAGAGSPPEARAAIGAERAATFNVFDYGAVGDGVTDDKDAIQDAIDAVVAAGGGQVFLPVGDYKMTTKITLGDNVELCGDGPNTVLRPAYASISVNRVIDNDWVNGNANITLRNFRLDRTGSNITHGILLNGVDNLLVDGVHITGFAGSGLNSGALSVSAIGPRNEPTPYLESKNVRVVNCVFTESLNFGCQVGYVDGCVMSNNTAYAADREVFGVEPEVGCVAKNVTISNNTIMGSVTTGSQNCLIAVTVGSGGDLYNVAVTGNSLRQPLGGTSTASGILVYGGTGVTVTGNTIYQMDASGIAIGNALNQSTGVVVSGNSIIDCNQSQGIFSGIRMLNGDHCIIIGNYIQGANHVYGIEEANPSGDNLIALNHLRDSAPLSLRYNSGTVAVGNKTTDGLPDVTVGDAQTYATRLNLDRYVSGNAAIAFQRAGVPRWNIANSGNESGSNSGSDLRFTALTDAGANLGTAVTVTRSNLKVSCAQALGVGTVLELGHASDTTISRTAAGAISVEGNPVGIKVAVPASASATGVPGQWAADANYIYACTATNTWVRCATDAW